MSEQRVCRRCVMDSTASDIVFDDDGTCNYCTEFLEKMRRFQSEHPDIDADLSRLVSQIKEKGRGKKYDCIVGVSGGVDSSYTLYLTVKLGLRPLAVHLDNGWNSELATHNIVNLVRKLDVDLYTHVINWDENRDLQNSFIKAHVVDIEMLMDNAMQALLYKQAAEWGVRYILSGTNLSGEGITMPPGWGHYKLDVKNIKCIHRSFGSVRIETHPLLSSFGYIWYRLIRRIEWVSFLNYVHYDKKKTLELLQEEVDFRPYLHKHYESVFTRFYQGYILPNKFGFDKRKVHLSSLVMTGQMPREDALVILQQSPYPDRDLEQEDRGFVIKKLGWSEEDFEDYLRKPAIPHESYGSEVWIYDLLKPFYKKT